MRTGAIAVENCSVRAYYPRRNMNSLVMYVLSNKYRLQGYSRLQAVVMRHSCNSENTPTRCDLLTLSGYTFKKKRWNAMAACLDKRLASRKEKVLMKTLMLLEFCVAYGSYEVCEFASARENLFVVLSDSHDSQLVRKHAQNVLEEVFRKRATVMPRDVPCKQPEGETSLDSWDSSSLDVMFDPRDV